LKPSSKNFEQDDDDDDDLDSLLASGSSANKPRGENKEPANSGQEIDSFPKLLPAEEKAVRLAFQIIGLLLESDTLRPSIWKQQHALFQFVWDTGLIRPSSPSPCALPSSLLQQDVLSLVAEKINDPNIMALRNENVSSSADGGR
jgi:hypothetical protein